MCSPYQQCDCMHRRRIPSSPCWVSSSGPSRPVQLVQYQLSWNRQTFPRLVEIITRPTTALYSLCHRFYHKLLNNFTRLTIKIITIYFFADDNARSRDMLLWNLLNVVWAFQSYDGGFYKTHARSLSYASRNSLYGFASFSTRVHEKIHSCSHDIA